jgi:hypothetical protein
MSILQKTKEEIADMLNISEYINDEMSELLYETACLFNIEIKHPFDPEITYEEFITEYRVKVHNIAEHYRELNSTT